MVLSPQQAKQRQERREQMSAEDRRLEAIEGIFDMLQDIRGELMSLNHFVAASARSKSSF